MLHIIKRNYIKRYFGFYSHKRKVLTTFRRCRFEPWFPFTRGRHLLHQYVFWKLKFKSFTFPIRLCVLNFKCHYMITKYIEMHFCHFKHFLFNEMDKNPLQRGKIIYAVYGHHAIAENIVCEKFASIKKEKFRSGRVEISMLTWSSWSCQTANLIKLAQLTKHTTSQRYPPYLMWSL